MDPWNFPPIKKTPFTIPLQGLYQRVRKNRPNTNAESHLPAIALLPGVRKMRNPRGKISTTDAGH
tara:strand:- start:61953 stop:62147 length:195 start_codon:yes stop_codon:yes gene_type:complete